MTLSTHVYVLDQIPPSDVLDECRRLLGATAAHPITDRESYFEDGSRMLGHPIGLGLPALLTIHHREGKALRTTESVKLHSKYCEPDCDGSDHDERPCWVDVDFDTAYAYTWSGGGCGELHAFLVTGLGLWLDSRDVRWEWRNEYTGDVHGGADRYERLLDLTQSSANAREWLENVVMPAIKAGALR